MKNSMFYTDNHKNPTVFYKQKENYVEVINMSNKNNITVSHIDKLPSNLSKRNAANLYRFAQHSFFNSKDFEWEFNGKIYKTCPLNVPFLKLDVIHNTEEWRYKNAIVSKMQSNRL
jgi:hypothetical protein